MLMLSCFVCMNVVQMRAYGKTDEDDDDDSDEDVNIGNGVIQNSAKNDGPKAPVINIKAPSVPPISCQGHRATILN